jgi:hypothetical protein
MGNLSRESFNVPPEFQRFLQERKLVQEKNAPFFAYWVSRFLAFARQRDIALIYQCLVRQRKTQWNFVVALS